MHMPSQGGEGEDACVYMCTCICPHKAERGRMCACTRVHAYVLTGQRGEDACVNMCTCICPHRKERRERLKLTAFSGIESSGAAEM